MKKIWTLSLAATLLAASLLEYAPRAAAEPAAAAASKTATPAAEKTVLPALDIQSIREAISGLPNAKATAALVYVGTPTDSWLAASGVNDMESKEPARADGRFRIGSITKVFTAAVVLQLVAEQKVDLNQSIQHYLPDVLPADFPTVTIGQLLNHTSGLPSPKLPDEWNEWDLQNMNWTPQQVVDLAVKNPMEFEPGTRQHYVNINYFLAGLLIEQVTGNPYEMEVQQRIVQPLHMTNTYLPGSSTRLIGTHAHGYQAVNQDGTTELVDVTEGSQSFTWAAGQIISTTSDLNTFMTALFTGKLVPRDVLENMFTVPEVPMWNQDGQDVGMATLSMGMMRTTMNGITFWGKTGARPGYGNGMFATRDLERRLVYSVNSTDAKGEGPNQIGNKIGMAAFGLK
ncbi:serine hydrolase domain-containing protein [Paenibacillus rigui]|uniref:Peptidase n=1 Tax=Paenibacillus rigui TaxID=554312 RepID=A0A229UIU3_9BACL|nr:serine hydrolase domain-containing protein [Paenibacillus rigui]OXM83326.1 peptidase [Paenibacillus rigui]